MPKFFETEDFKTLNKEWRLILLEAGFDDIEDEKEHIKNPSQAIFKSELSLRKEAKFQYFRCLAETTHKNYAALNARDLKVMLMRSDGAPIKTIADKCEIHRNTVRFIIRRYEDEWGIREWSDKQKKQKYWKSDLSYKIITIKSSGIPENFQTMIESQFLRSIKKGNEYFNLMDRESYFTFYRAYLRSLLARPQAILKMALLTDDPDNCIGWALFEPQKMHYIYVPPEMRKKGIASSLMSEEFSKFSHITKMAIPIWKSKYPDAKFDPFI